jgi:hypothetical protein
MPEEFLIWLIVGGALAPLLTLGLRKLLVQRWPLLFARDVPALLLSGAVTLAVSLCIVTYFTRVTVVGMILAFCVVQAVGHWIYKVIIQNIVSHVSAWRKGGASV